MTTNYTKKVSDMNDFFDDPTIRNLREVWLGHAPQSTLIIGHPGSGKSTLAASWPDPYFWCADNKMGGMPKRIREKTKTFKHGDLVYEWSMNKLDALADIDICKQLGIKTIVIDTITSFSEFLEVEILADKILNKENTAGLQRQHYNIIGLRIQGILRKCKEVGLDLVVISHIDEVMDDDGTMICHPNVTGKSQETKLAGKFDNVIYMTNNDDVYKARLKGNAKYPHAKISTSPAIHRTAPTLYRDLTYAKLQKILAGEIKKAEKKAK